MDNNFYARKTETLTKLRDTLQLAVNDLWELHVAEERAPAGDTSEIDPIFDSVTRAHQATSALLDAVKAMLP